MMAKILNHRNQLKSYCSSVNDSKIASNEIQTDIGFSEDLSVPVKHGSQSLKLNQQGAVHSRIVKQGNEKGYHLYNA